MTLSDKYFDDREIQSSQQRQEFFNSRLSNLIEHAKTYHGWKQHLKLAEAGDIRSIDDWSELPVLRKSELSALQKISPPLGGFSAPLKGNIIRLFESPGPVFEPQGDGTDFWRFARAFYAAGFRSGDIVHNTFSYHLTPGGWIVDAGLKRLGCTVIPAGIGNVEQQISAICQFEPAGYSGTPDFLKVLLDKAENSNVRLNSFSKALVSGGALFPQMRKDYSDRGISVYQAYATADVGLIAYESEALDGMIVDEDCFVEIVRPGTGDRLSDGEVGEVVVTSLNHVYPMIRLATGDLSAVIPGQSPCGRTNIRLRGWLGRADQTAKVRGMFVHPHQIAEIEKAHPEISRMRLTVSRENDRDQMTLQCAGDTASEELGEAVKATVRQVTKLSCNIVFVNEDEIPNDGLVIADERDYET